MSARRRNGRKRTTSPRHPLSGLSYSQPTLGFTAQVGVKPFKKGRRRGLCKLDVESGCREELLYETLRQLKNATHTRRKIPGTWDTRENKVAHLDLDDPRTKRPGLTYLYVGTEEGWDGDPVNICGQPCCLNDLVHFLDATVGQVGVLFDPDWYRGNWWETRPEDNNRPKGGREAGEFRYYGVSNFFLRHPSLHHIIMGLFRQALLVYSQGKSSGALERLNRKDVEKAMREGNPRLAWRNLQKIRRWVETPEPGWNYPFPRSYWGRLQQIHKAIYKHGCDKLFGGNIETGWNLNDKGLDEGVDGAWSYWGNQRVVTEAGKRLAQLGR